MEKILIYYQTFTSLKPLLNTGINNIYIYASSLHFGKNPDGNPYIHLNNSDPDTQVKVLSELKEASNNNTILFMLGGAGGAYQNLFSDFESYYSLLYQLITKFQFIKGIDLDVEEMISLPNIEMLINKLRNDFGKDFIITMAPVAYSLVNDYPGLGGFTYKDLVKKYGKDINWFNVQCYGCFDFDTINEIVNNGYSEKKIVMGMLGDDYDNDNFNNALIEFKKVKSKYKNIGGTILWEYGDTTINPIEWVKAFDKLR